MFIYSSTLRAAPHPLSLLCMYTLLCAAPHILPLCTYTCTHTRSEAYIKGAWEILHNDSFLQIEFGAVRKRKMGSFAGSYQLAHGKGSLRL